jgi:3-oxoacyl-[acyl-carrier-protein] synthase-1
MARDHAVAVTGVGVCSSLGGFVTACAAARAGISRPLDITEPESVAADPEPDDEVAAVTGHPAPEVASFRGAGRLVALGEQALVDLRAQHPDLEGGAHIGLSLCLTDQATRRPAPDPDDEPDRAELQEQARADAEEREIIAERLLELATLDVAPADRRLYDSGSAGLAAAVHDAAEGFAAGRIDACIIGAIDSQLDRATLELLADGGRLKGPDEANGLIPGEAAVFLHLQRPDLVRRQHRPSRPAGPILGEIVAAASARAEQPNLVDHPVRGTALLELFSQIVRPGVPLAPGGLWFVTDQNGETFRAQEWADFVLRARDRFPTVAEGALWYPAVSFGDIGAASGALGVALAVRSFARGYAPGRTAMVFSGTYEGLRGAVRVDAPASAR